MDVLQNLKILSIGTSERIALKIQFEHLIAAVANNCPELERLEFRWDRLDKTLQGGQINT